MNSNIIEIQEVLFNTLNEILLNELPDDIDTLSTHSRFEEINDINFIP